MDLKLLSWCHICRIRQAVNLSSDNINLDTCLLTRILITFTVVVGGQVVSHEQDISDALRVVLYIMQGPSGGNASAGHIRAVR
jgi:hypothetical protein